MNRKDPRDELTILSMLIADTRARIRKLEDHVTPRDRGNLSYCQHYIVDIDDEDGTVTCIMCGEVITEGE